MNPKEKSISQWIWLALAILCVLYGIVILSAGSGTWFFAVWFALAVVFVSFAFAARRHLWGMLPSIIKAVVLIILVAGLILFAVVEDKILKGFSAKGDPDLDYLIVLGSQVREDGPSRVLRYRLDTASDYLTENENTLCIVSGGQGLNEPYPEADGMKTYLVGRGIPEERIILENTSLTTTENIANSKKLIDPEKDTVGIVTNDFHVYRGTALAKKAGLNAVGIAAPSSVPFLPNNMFREFFAVIKEFLQGNI